MKMDKSNYVTSNVDSGAEWYGKEILRPHLQRDWKICCMQNRCCYCVGIPWLHHRGGKGASVTKLKEPHSLWTLKHRKYLKEFHRSKPSNIMLLIQLIKMLHISTPPYMVLKQMIFESKYRKVNYSHPKPNIHHINTTWHRTTIRQPAM